MDEDDLADLYRAEAVKSLDEEAQRRIAESADPILDERLRNTPLKDLIDSEELVPAIIARLGAVRAALEGHGGAIKVEHISEEETGLDLTLNLDGACIACGAAPGTLQGFKRICWQQERFGASDSAKVCSTRLMNWVGNSFSNSATSLSFEH